MSTKEGQADVTKSFTVDYVLVDPCGSETVTIKAAKVEDQEYTITGETKTYEPERISYAKPKYCTQETFVTIPSELSEVLSYDEDSETFTF